MKPPLLQPKLMEGSTLVFLPVGPKVHAPHLADTVESFLHFAAPASWLVLADDSRKAFDRASVPRDQRVIWRELPPARSNSLSTRGDFWARQAGLMRNLVEEFEFAQLLRIDDDSLFIKPGFESRAAALFAAAPQAGLLGQFRLMPDGAPVSNRWPKAQYQLEISLRLVWQLRHRGGLAARWRFRRAMRKLGKSAKALMSWAPGEHVTGGGYFINARCLRTMVARNLLPAAGTSQSELCDDHLISLSVQASGFGIKEAGGTKGMIGYRLDRLPADYTTLVDSSFAIVHSVRRHGDDDETRVRAELRRRTRAIRFSS
jgi:hypothetical protein